MQQNKYMQEMQYPDGCASFNRQNGSLGLYRASSWGGGEIRDNYSCCDYYILKEHWIVNQMVYCLYILNSYHISKINQ